MRPIARTLRSKGEPRLIDKATDAFHVIHMTRDQDFQIVGQADQPMIEHPMCRTRKSEAVVHHIRTVVLNRTNMRGVDFGTPASIELRRGVQARNVSRPLVGDRNGVHCGYDSKAR